MELNEINMILLAWNTFAAAVWLRHTIRDIFLKEQTQEHTLSTGTESPHACYMHEKYNASMIH